MNKKVTTIRPSDIRTDPEAYHCTFGWSELESAARRIVELSVERGGDDFIIVKASAMETDNQRDGFAALIAQGFLVQPDLDGRGGPALFKFTDEAIRRLKAK